MGPGRDRWASPRAGDMKKWTVPSHPGASTAALSRSMGRRRRRDTAPELALRRELFRPGLRYRVALPVPGSPRRSIDIAFPRRKVAVFVDGCFWHGCPDHGNDPRVNSSWWATKLAANRGRDEETTGLLQSQGWVVLRIWEHVPPSEAADAVVSTLANAADGA